MGPLVMKVLGMMDYGDCADEGKKNEGETWVMEMMANVTLKLLECSWQCFFGGCVHHFRHRPSGVAEQ